jgi:hypothetical protein
MALTVRTIQKLAAEQFGITVGEMIGPSRHNVYVTARKVAIYICRERLRMSYPELARAFRRKDHTTTRSAYKDVIAAIQREADAKANTTSVSRYKDSYLLDQVDALDKKAAEASHSMEAKPEYTVEHVLEALSKALAGVRDLEQTLSRCFTMTSEIATKRIG